MRSRILEKRLERAEQAARVDSKFLEQCICFPPHEQPEFRWRAEAEAAATVLCPIHGLRFQIVVTRFLYRPLLYYLTDFESGWPHRSQQYQKAMQASFDPALWPVREEVTLGSETMLILRDGRQIPSGGTAISYVPGEHIPCKQEAC